MTEFEPLPLVSAIITTYDRSDLLQKAIDSVARQTYPKIELVVVDDYSPESPKSVVDNCDQDSFENIVFTRHKKNRGVSAARNTGIEQANGELLAFLDDDDTWLPEKVEKQVRALEKADNARAVYTGVRSISKDRSVIMERTSGREGDLTKDLLCGFAIWFPTLMIHRSLISDAGKFDEEMLMFEDKEWVVRLSRHTNFISIKEPLLVTLRDDEHIQKSDNIEKKIDHGYSILLEKYRTHASNYGRLFERKVEGHCHFWMGYSCLSGGNDKLARSYLLKAVCSWPFSFRFFIFLILSHLGHQSYIKARNIKRKLSDWNSSHEQRT